jgi:hypothetical protein
MAYKLFKKGFKCYFILSILPIVPILTSNLFPLVYNNRQHAMNRANFSPATIIELDKTGYPGRSSVRIIMSFLRMNDGSC